MALAVERDEMPGSTQIDRVAAALFFIRKRRRTPRTRSHIDAWKAVISYWRS